MKRVGKRSLKFWNESSSSAFSEGFNDGYTIGRMESALQICHRMGNYKDELNTAVWELCGLPKTDYDALVDWFALKKKARELG